MAKTEFIPADRLSAAEPDTIPRGRARVTAAFTNVFDRIGGEETMAAWALENPSRFYSLYAKLLPSQNATLDGDSKETRVLHALPPTELDALPSAE